MGKHRENRLFSKPAAEMKESYDVIVIGSGYGGSIAASRMARAGRTLCLLEKGREFRVGDFPSSLEEATVEMQATLPDGGHIGRENGLYNFTIGEDISVFWGCGLGGTSLVNANVSLEADPRVFDDPVWPVEFRADKTGLDKGYQLARQMLQPNPYPDGFPKINKLETLRKSAESLQANFYKTPINVTFQEGKNPVGMDQPPCNGCGDCVTGCNYGSKNTVAMNYIPDAYGHGAEIFTQIDVLYVEKESDGWIVHFNSLGDDRAVFGEGPMFVRAKLVFICGGTLGSTQLLMRSRDQGLSVSSRLGERFTGNGDVLGFAYNCDMPINSDGWGNVGPGRHDNVGPCITGVIDMRNTQVLDHGMVIEDGSIPSPLAKLMPAAFAAADEFVGKDTDDGFFDRVKEKAREFESIVLGPYHGAVRRTQVYLVMSQDNGDGKLELKNGRIHTHWPGVGTSESYQRVQDRLYQTTKPLGGAFVRDPITTPLLHNKIVTVHPLGGCCMGENADSGVVDHKGRVFAGRTGSEVHEGLYVTDGSVMPRPLGVNPLLTISAVSERCVALAAKDRGWSIDYALKPIAMPVVDNEVGIEFTERMKGRFELGAKSYEEGEKDGQRFQFTLTIYVDDLDKFLNDPNHTATMFGTVEAPSLTNQPLDITRGMFNLFKNDPDRPEAQHMVYQAVMEAEDGKAFFLDGFKQMHTDPIWDIWSATTTLYFTVYEGRDNKGRELGKGMLYITIPNFARQMTTMKAVDAKGTLEGLKAVAKFGKFFAGDLFEMYGGVLAGSYAFDPDAPPRKQRELRLPPPQIYPVQTSDGTIIRLTRYTDGTKRKGPVMLTHGLAVSSRIFNTDTIDTNMAEFLYAHNYDVWLLDFRQSILLSSAYMPSTGDDVATKDYPAAVNKIREVTGVDKIQVMAHCFGATTFLMSLLSGLQGVRSAVSSQIGIYPLTPLITQIKCGVYFPELLGELGIRDLTAYTTTEDNWREKLFNQAIKLQPVPFEERCKSDVCHRITFLFSLLYEHDKLNDLTHDNLQEMFGVGNIEAFKHLSKLVRAKELVNARDEDVYMPHLDRLAFPLTFIHGSENLCFVPEGTEQTIEKLRSVNGEKFYERHVIPGYGHIDCIFGRDAAKDVFPIIVAALDKDN